MEIYKNGSWQKLCTRKGGTKEENLTCKAMGYTNGGVYNDRTWYMYADYSNAFNSSIHSNCTSLTDCKSDINDEIQLCKGIDIHSLSLSFLDLSWPNLAQNKYIDIMWLSYDHNAISMWEDSNQLITPLIKRTLWMAEI